MRTFYKKKLHEFTKFQYKKRLTDNSSQFYLEAISVLYERLQLGKKFRNNNKTKK